MGLLLALCVLDRQDYWVDLPAVPGRRLRHRAGRGGGRGDENREGDGEGAEGAGRGGGQGDIGLGGGRPPPRRRGQRGQRGRVRGRGRGRAGREQRGPGRGVGVERDLERPYGPPSARRPPALKLDRQEVKAPSKRHLAQETASVRELLLSISL